MSAEYEPFDWRRPGCDQRCQIRTVIATGMLRRVVEPVHDPDAHEEHGAHVALGPGSNVVRSGPLVVDLWGRTVRVGQRECVLTPREWTVLVCIAAARGGHRSTQEIAQALWPEDALPVMLSARHASRIWVGRVRAKLGDAESLIETTTGIGYRLRMLPPSDCMPPGPRRRWAQHYDACVRCQRTEHQHDSHGLCVPCRSAVYKLARQASGLPRRTRGQRRPFIDEGTGDRGQGTGGGS